MTIRTLTTAAFAAGALVLAAGGAATASTNSTTSTGTTATSASEPQVINDADLKAETITMGGASVLPTTRTIPHWFGKTTDPSNGVTYGYNMVGADPHTCSGTACDVTVQVDITPIKVVIGGQTFDGSGRARSHARVTAVREQRLRLDAGGHQRGSSPSSPGPVASCRRPTPGCRSSSRTRRCAPSSPRTGTSTYHLRLHPNVLAPVTITVPSNQGTLIQSGRGVLGGNVDVGWWSSKINNLETSADPTHLPLYLTDNIFLHSANDPTQCCIIGYHGTKAAGDRQRQRPDARATHRCRPSPGRPTSVPASTPAERWHQLGAAGHPRDQPRDRRVGGRPVRQQHGEPVAHADRSAVRLHERPRDRRPRRLDRLRDGHQHLLQGPNPNGTQSADGYYHPEDEALLPWFLRLPSNATGSEANQYGSGGRYTLMGDLNPFPGFRAPATGC